MTRCNKRRDGRCDVTSTSRGQHRPTTKAQMTRRRRGQQVTTVPVGSRQHGRVATAPVGSRQHRGATTAPARLQRAQGGQHDMTKAGASGLTMTQAGRLTTTGPAGERRPRQVNDSAGGLTMTTMSQVSPAPPFPSPHLPLPLHLPLLHLLLPLHLPLPHLMPRYNIPYVFYFCIFVLLIYIYINQVFITLKYL